MWSIKNRTPYGAERNWVRDKQGRHHWVLAVKATFDVAPSGTLSLSDVQPPPALAPEYFGAPGNSSLRCDSDLLYIKTCTDVIVHAYAYAPRGQPCREVQLGLRAGGLQKHLVAYGERRFYRGLLGLKLSSPTPFERKAVRYELSYGGQDFRDSDPRNHGYFAANPIGRGFAMDSRHLIDQPGPEIEQPGVDPARAGAIGFGPIDVSWSPRRERAGTFDDLWARDKKPLLPDDFDEKFGSCAPEDQRADLPFRGGEPVELEGMSPSGRLHCTLPRIYLTYATRFGRRVEQHRGRLVTVILMPEQSQLALVWQSTLYVSPKDGDYLDETVVGEKSYLT